MVGPNLMSRLNLSPQINQVLICGVSLQAWASTALMVSPLANEPQLEYQYSLSLESHTCVASIVEHLLQTFNYSQRHCEKCDEFFVQLFFHWIKCLSAESYWT